MPQRPENPFGSRFTRPGALPFLLSPVSGQETSPAILPESDNQPLASRNAASEDVAQPSVEDSYNPAKSKVWLDELLEGVKASQRTAIIGPHGAGKTTLLNELEPLLERIFPNRVARVTLKIGQPHVALWSELDHLVGKGEQDRLSNLLPGGVLIIDGFEQLGWTGRIQLAWHLHQRPVRLLVTAHQPPAGFRVLARLEGNQAIAKQLAAWLLRDHPMLRSLVDDQFDLFWSQSQGNVRDLWAILYEWFEAKIPMIDKGWEKS